MADITPNIVVSMPSQIFTQRREFKSCSNGKIYIGKIDTDPTIAENQIQVYLENEDGKYTPVAQPLMIGTGGFPVYNGQIAKFVTEEGHAMAVYDGDEVQQFYYPNVLRYEPDQLAKRLASPEEGLGDAMIAVKQPYPKSVARTQHDKNADTICVKDFGAKGDFLTDDTTAIQAAIDAASTYSVRGGTVYFSGGIYNVSATLTVPQWVSLEGAGIETSQIRCTAPNDSVSPIVKVTGSHNGIRKMTLRYATRPYSKGVGIISTSFQAKYHQIQIIDCHIGAWIYNPDSKESAGSGQVWSDFFIKDCSYAGMIVGVNNNDFYNDLYLSNFLMVADSSCFKFGALRLLGRIESLNVEYCDIMGGVHSLTSDPGKTSGVRFSVFTSMYLDSATYSCEFNGINHSSFTDCWISCGRGSGSSGAEFQSCHSFSMTGMRAYNCGSNAITFKSCNNFTIDKTIIGGNNKSSIPETPDVNFIGCDKFNVVNTHGTDVGNTNYGIRIASGCTAYTLMNNKFTARSSGLILEDDINSAARLVDGNPGYMTRNGGRAFLPAGAKSVDVSHGLSVEPKINMVIIQQNGQTLTPLYVSSVSKDTFTVSTLQENQSGASFSWLVDATRSG